MSFERFKIKISTTGDCKLPKILLVGYDSTIDVNCINEACGEYEVQIERKDDTRCFTFSVTCDNCATCPPQLITKCLCTTNGDCPDKCDSCDNGVCNPKCANGCDNGICLDDCIQCSSTCPLGKICTPYIRQDGKECKKCSCPPGKQENSFGDCVDCISDSHCGKCESCVGYGCKPKDCSTGVCDPITGSCEVCINSGDCGINQCCVTIGSVKKCQCCDGFIKDIHGNCVPKPPCLFDEDCSKCESCKKFGDIYNCVPRQCPDGTGCDDGECKPLCDCTKPSSCGPNKQCKNKGHICVCETCGACATGCAQGCIDKCASGQGCQPNPCDIVENPKNGADCGPDCGYNPITGKCEPCSIQTCGTNCGNLVGCSCAGGTTCEKVTGGCSGSCENGFDCGPNCTCYHGQCVPCSFFSCNNGDCSSQEKCKCTGAACDGDPSAKCADVLSITKKDDCTIEGRLVTAKGCPCPDIKVKLNNPTITESATTLSYIFNAELFKGEIRIDKVDQPGIAENETASSGFVSILADIVYNNGLKGTASTSMAISDKGQTADSTPLIAPKFGVNHGTVLNPKYVESINFTVTISQAAFKNTCDYPSTNLTSKLRVQSNSTKVEVTGIISSSGTKLPLFTWYKSSNGVFGAKLKDKYVSKTGADYVDILTGANDEAKSCNDYKLKVDCGCANSQVKRITFCNPQTFSALFRNCNTQVDIVIPACCAGNTNLPYQLLIDTGAGYVPEISNIILNGGWSTGANPITKIESIVGVKLKLLCDTSNECVVEKKPSIISKFPIIPIPVCDGKNVNFTFTNNAIKNITWGTEHKTYIPGASLVFTGVSDVTYPYTVEFLSGCTKYDGTAFKSCTSAHTPMVMTKADCTKYTFTGLEPTVEYKVNGVVKTIAQLNDLAVVDTPTSLSYKVISTGEEGSITLPSKSSCTGCSFTVNSEQVGSTLVVTVTGTGTAYKVTLTGASAPPFQTIAGGASATFPVINGNYSIKVENTLSPGCTPSISPKTVTSCATNLIVGESDCNITATNTGACSCKDVVWEAKVTSVNTLTDTIFVNWESTIQYQDALITGGTVTVQTTPAGTPASLNAQGYASGSISIPCVGNSVKYTDIPWVITVVEGGTIGKLGLHVTLPAPYQNDITGITINGITASHSSGAPFYDNNVWWIDYDYYSTVPITGGFEITTTTFGLLKTDFHESIFKSYSANGTLSLFKTEYNCPDIATTRFKLTGLSLEDGCTYGEANLEVPIMNVQLPSSKKTNPVVLVPSARKMKYTWTENNVITKQEFSNTLSTFSGATIDLSKELNYYRVKSECNCISQQQAYRKCLTLPTFKNLLLNSTGTQLSFTVSGGCYNAAIVLAIGTDTYNYTKVLNSDLSATITLTTQITGPGTSIIGYYRDKPDCKFYGSVAKDVYTVIETSLPCATSPCTSLQYKFQVRVTKNGVAFPTDSYSIGGLTLPIAAVPDTTKAFYTIGCIPTASTTSYTVNIGSYVISRSLLDNKCSLSCTPLTYDILYPNIVCLGNVISHAVLVGSTSSTITIDNILPTGLGALDYSLNNGVSFTAMSGNVITIPYAAAVAGTQVVKTIRIKKQSEASTCGVDKQITFDVLDCSTPPPDISVPNCDNPSLNLKPVINSNNLTGPAGACSFNLGDTFPMSVSPNNCGSGACTYDWVTTDGAVTLSASTGSSITGTITSFGGTSNNIFHVSVTIWNSDHTCSTSRGFFGYKQLLSCPALKELCGTGCDAVCGPIGNCVGNSVCNAPNTPCGTTGGCCIAPLVCDSSKKCVSVAEDCGKCGKINDLGKCVEKVPLNACSCCSNGDIKDKGLAFPPVIYPDGSRNNGKASYANGVIAANGDHIIKEMYAGIVSNANCTDSTGGFVGVFLGDDNTGFKFNSDTKNFFNYVGSYNIGSATSITIRGTVSYPPNSKGDTECTIRETINVTFS